MARRPDPHIAARMRAEAFFRRKERKLHAAVILVMTAWLDDARTLILDGHLPNPGLTAAADQPDFNAVNASFETWRRGLNQHIEPVIAETFGEAFAAHSRAADITPIPWQEHHMATVHDRLKIWPEGAFEELRPELLEAMTQNEDIDQITDRIGRTLDIDAPSRRIRADISAIDRKLADPTTPAVDIPGLKGRRRTLWNQHDESLLDWQWKARRIARTEIQGAINAGTWASAEATAQITGETLHKAWLATHDERTRVEHVVADGQIVPISTSFSVAGYPMMYPADPFAPGHLSINCRCTMRILTPDEVQDELQGMWGGRGVGPGNARLGPDEADDITRAIDRWKREQRGEVVGDERTPAQIEKDERREAPDRLNPDWTEEPAVRPYEGNPVDVVDPEPDTDDYAPIIINIGSDDGRDDDWDDDEPSGNSGEFDNDRDDDDVDLPDDEPDSQADEDTDVPDTDTPDDDRPLNEQFDDHFADTVDQYTPEQRDAINQWQGIDRFYERVQKVARNPDFEDDEAQEVLEHLDEAIQQAVLPDDTTLWRGIRDSHSVFGVANTDLPTLIGETIQSPGFLAASTSRDVAIGFTEPSRRGGHVLLQLQFAAGTPVVWVSAAGDPELADQYEALFGAALYLHLVSVEYTGNVPTVVAEVIPNVDNAE